MNNGTTPRSLADLEAQFSEKPPVEISTEKEATPIVVEETEAKNELNELLSGSHPALNSTDNNPLNIQEETDTRSDIEKLLSNITFDLSQVNIRKTDNPIELFEEIQKRNIFNATYEVIPLQSAYRVSFRGMNLNTRIAARKISGTNYEQTYKLLKMIYDHIESTNLGKITFDTWLKITAEDDVNTIIFGIYGATYPKESDYSIGCPHCGSRNEIKISKEKLIQVFDQKSYKLVAEILGQNLPPIELVKRSCVNHVQRILLPDSKDLIDLGTPTLKDMLDALTKSNNNRNVEPELFGILKYVNKFAVISHKALLERKVIDYIEISSEEQQIERLNNLTDTDKKTLEKAIEEKLKDFEVKYRVPNFKCNKCTKDVVDVDIGMSEVLFTKLAQG